jgi:VIT1/CCC1 family predicted Fe2+/Mn2+ transporter
MLVHTCSIAEGLVEAVARAVPLSSSAMDDVSPQERRHHDLADPHRRAPWLAEIVLGGQDGIVNVLGVILGVAAATGNVRIVLVAGLAAAFAESVSMAAVAYTSTAATGDLYKSERAREYRHIEKVPHLERAEVRTLYERKGFHGVLLDRIVETITSNKDVWVAVMMAEEHGLADVDRAKSLRSSAVVGVASLVGSLLPLAPFVVLPVASGSLAAVVLAALVLFAFGAYKAKVTVGHPFKSGIELALIGTLSALAGYAVGALFGAPAP